ncbi:MAG: hypothetical protein Fur0023_14000 [Bacteroidia bacterium]
MKIYNPYPQLNKTIVGGLNFIADNLNENSDVNDLVNNVYSYIQKGYYLF